MEAAEGSAREEGPPAVPILVLAGMNLTLVQYGLLRELTSLVGSSEVVALVVVTAYFLGLSLGYLVSDRLSERALIGIALASLALHASMPFLARVVAGTFARVNLAGNSLPFFFALVLLGVTPFYAVFLPRLTALASRAGEAPLARLYATEILGAIAGMGLLVLLTPARLDLILAAHLAGLVALLLLFARGRRRALAWTCALPLLYVYAFPAFDRASTTYYYRWAQDFDDPVVVASELSPYQRVDVIQEGGLSDARRFLYLDGRLFWGTRRLHEHNLFVSLLPSLARPGAPSASALVLGGGSLDSARYLAPRVGRLTVVELDEAVVRITREHIQSGMGALPTNFRLVVDDAKHFLGEKGGEPFDVISVDIPVPTHLQTAMLHSERFFRLARSRLAPGGTLSISLSGSLTDARPEAAGILSARLAHRVLAGLYRVFPHVLVVSAGGREYAWASEAAPSLDAGAIARAIDALGEAKGARERYGSPKVEIMPDAKARARAAGYEPIGEADMQVVLRLSLDKLYSRYYEPRRG